MVMESFILFCWHSDVEMENYGYELGFVSCVLYEVLYKGAETYTCMHTVQKLKKKKNTLKPAKNEITCF
jgi:hypothetical protein